MKWEWHLSSSYIPEEHAPPLQGWSRLDSVLQGLRCTPSPAICQVRCLKPFQSLGAPRSPSICISPVSFTLLQFNEVQQEANSTQATMYLGEMPYRAREPPVVCCLTLAHLWSLVQWWASCRKQKRRVHCASAYTRYSEEGNQSVVCCRSMLISEPVRTSPRKQATCVLQTTDLSIPQNCPFVLISREWAKLWSLSPG